MILYKELFIDQTDESKVYEPSSIQEAYMAVFYAILFSDWKWKEKESKALKQVISCIRDFEDEDDIYFLQKVKNLSETYTLKSLLVGGLDFIDQSDRPRLFCFCAELVIADKKVTEQEKKILNYIADHSNLSPQLANKIIEVSLIRMGSE